MVALGRNRGRKPAATGQERGNFGARRADRRRLRATLALCSDLPGLKRGRQGHFHAQPNAIEASVDRDRVIGKPGRSTPYATSDRELAERSLVAQGVAVQELNDGVVEGGAAIELIDGWNGPEPVVAFTARTSEAHFIAALGQLHRLPHGSVDRCKVKWLIDPLRADRLQLARHTGTGRT